MAGVRLRFLRSDPFRHGGLTGSQCSGRHCYAAAPLISIVRPQSLSQASVTMSPAEVPPIYPTCPSIARAVRVGGVSKRELLAQFQRCGIELNEAGQTLFARDEFKTSETSSVFATVEISVSSLGYAQGATIAQLYAAIS